MSKNYELIKIILGSIIFFVNAVFSMDGLPFMIMFILGDVAMIVLDIVYRKEFKEKLGVVIGIYIFYNYIGFRIMGINLLHLFN